MIQFILRDDQWERIKDLLPSKVTDCGVTAKDNRLFVEGVEAEAVGGRTRATLRIGWWGRLPLRVRRRSFLHVRVAHNRVSMIVISTKIVI
jgi:hypothetical protein